MGKIKKHRLPRRLKKKFKENLIEHLDMQFGKGKVAIISVSNLNKYGLEESIVGYKSLGGIKGNIKLKFIS